MIRLFIREKNNIEENLRKYEEKKAKQQESKILGQKPVNYKGGEEKKRVHACTTHNGVKVYAVWYK